MKIVDQRHRRAPAPAALPIWQIGTDGGFLPEPVPLRALLLGPAERVDVIVDFTGVPEGTELYLVNEGPDELYGGGRPGVDFPPATRATTGQVMKLRGRRLRPARTRSVPPEHLRLPPQPRRSGRRPADPPAVPRRAMSGARPVDPDAARHRRRAAGGLPLRWSDPVDRAARRWATPRSGRCTTSPRHAHPVHLHQVQFEVLGRGHSTARSAPASLGDRGRKDTVLAYPGEVTRVKAASTCPAATSGTATCWSTRTTR